MTDMNGTSNTWLLVGGSGDGRRVEADHIRQHGIYLVPRSREVGPLVASDSDFQEVKTERYQLVTLAEPATIRGVLLYYQLDPERVMEYLIDGYRNPK